ncbi:thioesterase II family protein [Saccharopolyspora rosea]|uniref:Thioesterase II family protein n=1 Tax=Saccharopolyspora rosea TaxID=524884 RepID=A0ABW3FT82_9PSEU|nr:alpha/beta fold hydrolase [Saccharopolyspora rosea]
MASHDSSRWIRRFHPRADAEHRLVCFPHAGGSASFFHPLSAGMAPSIEVLAVQYPGRQDRRHEEVLDDITELADHLAEVLLDWTARPLTFFGHSMGATVAFEVARRLERRGVVPVGLFASARRAPSCLRDEAVHRTSDEELIREIAALDGTPPALLSDEELLRLILPAVRGDYKAAETYRYQPGPDVNCPITAVIGDTDPKVTPAEARAWARHTTGEFALRVLPGGHFYLREHLSTVIDAISDHVRATTTRS